MFDESGSNYRPILTPEKKTPVIEPPPLPQQQLERVAQVLRQPWWVRLTSYYLILVSVFRFLGLRGESLGGMVAQIASIAMITVMIVGLSGMRRWGAWLLILFCAGSVLSAVITGGYRIYLMDSGAVEVSLRFQLIFGEMMNMGMVSVFYGVIGGWYLYKSRIFLPVPAQTVLYIGLVGVIVLYTAVQLTFARQDIELREEITRENTSNMNSWFR